MAKNIIEPIIEDIPLFPSPQALFNYIKDFPYVFFLDSTSEYGRLGRYSFLGYDPFLVFRSKKNAVALEWYNGRKEAISSNPFTCLKNIFKRYNYLKNDSPIPFTSGGVGYFSYDMKDLIEELPDTARDDLDLPDCVFCFYDCLVAYDHILGKAYIISSGLPYKDNEKNRFRRNARLKHMKDVVAGALKGVKKENIFFERPVLKSNFSRASYIEAVSKAKDYIREGDIYQVNLSQRFNTEFSNDPAELYNRLRKISPAPFSAYLNMGESVIASSSPERFIYKRGDYIETRPIKGTRPRGKDSSSDKRFEKELMKSVKDSAEHIMIVDLERNDLGKICEYGSVAHSENKVLERYPQVLHLVSTVSGIIKGGLGPIDCLVGTFPGGSITGAPKIRSMEIIEELEGVKRSVYTGAIGYISFDGNMDTSIAIRTFIIKNRKIYFSVGGGIVSDSDPIMEYEETLDKARGMIEALGLQYNENVTGKKETYLVWPKYG